MSTPPFSFSLPHRSLRRFRGQIRERASLDEIRARREHDAAMASDYRIAAEHRAQVSRSIELGRGGCRFCG
ncbi:MAG TPA: hypothetical protein VL977_00145 [Solirubrobacteraceae bacterium]|nr:hypothetical protein [Solirubrobacteraceae bacterium]